MSDELFGFMTRPSRGQRRIALMLARHRREGDRLVPYIALSVAAHVLLLGLLAVAKGRGGGVAPAAESNRAAIRQTLESLRLDPQESQLLREALAQLDDDAYEYIFEHSPALDPRLSERERTDILRSLVRGSVGRLKERRVGLSALDFPPWEFLPGAALQNSIKTESGDILIPLDTSPDGRPTFYRAGGAALQRLGSLREEKKGRRKESLGGKIDIRTDAGFARVPDEYYYRVCPYESMIALGGSLFYAVSGFPRLEPPAERAASGEVADERGRPVPQDRIPGPPDAIKVVFMSPAEAAEGPAARETLPDLPGLTEASIPRILDGLMALDDREQVRVFMERFLVGRDLDDPMLAHLTRQFLYENLGGAFNLGSRLSTAFDVLEELYYDKTTQSDLIAFGLRNGSSLAGREIRFFLASLIDFERRALGYLADSLDLIQDAAAGRAGGRAEVFDKAAKAFVLGQVYRDLAAGLERRGMDAIDDILQEYADEQERIYRSLIAEGGETAGRARFALGGLYWDEKREARALKEWRAIDPAFETPTLNQIRWIMDLTYGQDLSWSRINAVFAEESARNSRAALERCVRFHLWEKRSARAGTALPR
jgi:hypothetical protein